MEAHKYICLFLRIFCQFYSLTWQLKANKTIFRTKFPHFAPRIKGLSPGSKNKAELKERERQSLLFFMTVCVFVAM